VRRPDADVAISYDDTRKLGERRSLNAYCGRFGSGFGGGPTVSQQTLSQLADLGLSVTIKAYWRSTEPDE